MPTVTFTTPKAVGVIALGRYACRLHIETIQKDAQKNPMLDADNKPAKIKSQAGFEQWDVRPLILEGPFAGRELWDNWTFSPKGFDRINVIMIRGGFGKVGETVNLEADDLEGSLWWVTVDSHEDSKKTDKNGVPFKNAKVAYAGYEPMSKEEVAKYAKVQPPAAASNGAAPVANEDRPPF